MNFLLLEKTSYELASKAHSSSFSAVSAFGQIVFLIVVFAFIIFLAYYSTKVIAKNRIKSMSGNNIVIIESINIGLGLCLHIIKAGEQYFLISATKEKIELISELNKDTIKETKNNSEVSFEKIMRDCFAKIKQPKNEVCDKNEIE